MEKASMRERAMRVILSGVMVVGMTPIVMAAPTITGVEQAQTALAAELSVTAESYSGKYDGQTHQVTAVPSITEGTTVTYSTDGGVNWTTNPPTIKDVGKLTVKARAQKGVQTMDCQYTLEVTTRAVTLTSASASKEYDGYPLTNDEVVVSGDGFVGTEGAGFSVTGSQTEVGSSKNTFTYTAKSGTNLDNYDITKAEGTLTITAPEPEWQTFGGCEWSIDNAGALTIRPKEDQPEPQSLAGVETYAAGQLPDGCTKPSDWPWYASKATITSVTVEDGVTAGDSLAFMFDQYTKLTSVDLSGLTTENTKNMKRMFDICSSLVEVKGLGELDTSSVTDMSYMFCACTSLLSIEGVDKLSASAAESLQGMFTTSGVSAEKRTEYIKALLATNGGKCTDWTNRLFCGCTETAIDLSKLDTSNVTDMDSMFASCYSLESLDLSALDTSKVTTMKNMFRGCSALKTISVSKDKWSTEQVTSSTSMFFNCKSLVGGAGTRVYPEGSETTENPIDATYARIDGGAEAPGYLTAVAEELVAVYRLYNGATGEHLWTTDTYEYAVLTSYGWTQEDVAWMGSTSGKAVYRLYNAALGKHHYTADENEVATLVSSYGWTNEGVSFYAAPEGEGNSAVYRLYNGGLSQHLLTMDYNEVTTLSAKYGWDREGVAFYVYAVK